MYTSFNTTMAAEASNLSQLTPELDEWPVHYGADFKRWHLEAAERTLANFAADMNAQIRQMQATIRQLNILVGASRQALKKRGAQPKWDAVADERVKGFLRAQTAGRDTLIDFVTETWTWVPTPLAETIVGISAPADLAQLMPMLMKIMGALEKKDRVLMSLDSLMLLTVVERVFLADATPEDMEALQQALTTMSLQPDDVKP